MKQTFDETLLSAYLDGELSDSQRQVVEEHLRRSPEARQTLKELGEVSALLRALPGEALPEQFPRRVLRSAERQTLLPASKPAASKRAYYWWTGAGAAVAAAVLVMIVLRPSPEEPLQVATLSQRNETLEQDTEFQETRDAAPASDEAAATPRTDVPAAAAVREEAAETPKAEAVLGGAESLADAGQNAAATMSAAKPEERRPQLFFFNDLRSLKSGEVADALVAAGDELLVVEVTVIDVRRGIEEIEVLFAGALPVGKEGETNVGSALSGLHLVQVKSDAQSFERNLERLQKKNPGLFLSLAIDPEVPEPVRRWVNQQTGRDPASALERTKPGKYVQQADVIDPESLDGGRTEPGQYVQQFDKDNHELLDERSPRRGEARSRPNGRALARRRPESGRAKDVPLNVFLLVREPRDDEEPQKHEAERGEEPAESVNHPPGEQPSLP